MLELRRTAAALGLIMMLACGSSSSLRRAVVDTTLQPHLIAGDGIYTPGEFLAWKVKWKGLAGGEAQLIVGKPTVHNGIRMLIVRSVTQTTGILAALKHLRDELITTVNLGSGTAVSNRNNIESGTRKRSMEVAFSRGSYELVHREVGTPIQAFSQTVPNAAASNDLHTIMAKLRAWKVEPGSRGFFYIQSGRELFRVEVTHVGKERVEAPMGEFDSIRYEAVARLHARLGKRASGTVRKMTMWITDDANRLPIKLVAETQYGDVYAIITDHRLEAVR